MKDLKKKIINKLVVSARNYNENNKKNAKLVTNLTLGAIILLNILFIIPEFISTIPERVLRMVKKSKNVLIVGMLVLIGIVAAAIIYRNKDRLTDYINATKNDEHTEEIELQTEKAAEDNNEAVEEKTAMGEKNNAIEENVLVEQNESIEENVLSGKNDSVGENALAEKNDSVEETVQKESNDVVQNTAQKESTVIQSNEKEDVKSNISEKDKKDQVSSQSKNKVSQEGETDQSKSDTGQESIAPQSELGNEQESATPQTELNFEKEESTEKTSSSESEKQNGDLSDEEAVNQTGKTTESIVDKQEEESLDTQETKQTERSKEAENKANKQARDEWDNVDFKAFKKDYPETVGWLYIEDTAICYPVMQSKDNEKYLNVGYTGEEANTGAIFLDYRSSEDFSDANSIVYGHNMKDKTMFGTLRAYRESQEFYDEHQYFQIITSDAKYRYQVFAYMDVPNDSVIYDYIGEEANEFIKDAEPVRLKSYRDSEIPVNEDDKVVTLSTCTSKDDLRFVVLGVLVSTEKK